MKTYINILLDLDGTIIDPFEGITKSLEYALQYFDIQIKDKKELNRFIGPPIKDSFKDFYHFSDEQANKAIAMYRDRYEKEGVYENRLYDGITDFLQRANRKGMKLFVATSKPEPFARKILEYLSVSKEFVFIGGSKLDGTRQQKAEVIRYVLNTNKITSLSQTVMIGDRKYDIVGAREVGIDSIGVLYGYGDYSELTEVRANYIVKDIPELSMLLNI